MKRSILLLAVLTLAACSDSGRRDENVVHMIELNPANAERDAEAALRANDNRLIVVRGFSTEVPGTDLNILDARSRYGTIVVEGTSDEVELPGERALNARAREYASRYNEVIIRRVSDAGAAPDAPKD